MVVVIIVLGVLSATALPKFIDLKRDAHIAALEGLKGVLESALPLIYSKVVIDGREKFSVDENQLSGYTVNGIEISYGYPYSDRDSVNIMEAIGISKNDWHVISDTPSGETYYTMFYPLAWNTWVYSWGEGYSCFVAYSPPSEVDHSDSMDTPNILMFTDDC